MTILSRLREYALLIRLHRPIGILLLLWPTLWGLWIAGAGSPSLTNIFVFVVGTILMRSAGCAINDYADRDFDGAVQRTADRPLAARRIQPREAVAVAAVLALTAFAITLAFTNLLTVQLSFGAVFLAVTYPFTKRFLAMPQAYLGIAFGFGIPMAFAAETGSVPPLAWVLLLANVFWTLAYDTEYAMVDRDDDLRLGLRTTAILFGRFDVAMVMTCYVLMLLVLGGAGRMAGLGVAFTGGLFIAAVIMAGHYRQIRERTREGCFAAFLNNNWVGAVIFGGVVAAYVER